MGAKFGLMFLAKMYIVPYWINVIWLDVVTYLHHTDNEVRDDRGYHALHASVSVYVYQDRVSDCLSITEDVDIIL